MNYLDELLQIQKDYATKMLEPGMSTDPNWQAAGNMSNPSAYNMGLMDLLRASQQNMYNNTQNLPAAPNYLDLIALRGLQPDNFAPPAAVTPGSTQANNPVMVPDINSYPGAPGQQQPQQQLDISDLDLFQKMLAKSGLGNFDTGSYRTPYQVEWDWQSQRDGGS